MPTMVTAMADSDTQITVRWQAPADNGGADITGYMVESAYEMSDGTMSDWMAVDPAHEGMEMMYVDMGLMPMTKYYYRVSAMNSVGTGMASDGMAYAMTSMTPTAPMASGTIADVMMTVGDAAVMRDASVAFTEADGDAVTYAATSSNTDAATVSVSGNMISIMAVGAGDSTVSVTASDKDGMSDAVTFMVMVEAAAPMELGAPSNVIVNPQGSGLVQVNWDTAPNAHGYTIIAINVADLSPTTKVLDNPEARVTQIELTQGETYNIYVGSWAPDPPGAFEVDLSERKRVEVE